VGGRWDGRAGRSGRCRRLLAAILVAAAATMAGPGVDAEAAGGTTATDRGTTPSAEGSATQSGGTTPVADNGSDGGALAVWVAGEVILLVAGAVALRLWTGRRARRARNRPDERRPPVDACDACTSGLPCARGATPGGRCDRPAVRIRL